MTAQSSGFTLIELLVVVAIIGLLSSVALFSLTKARASARDAKRKTDAKALLYALDVYYQENEIYPANSSPGTASYINDSFLVQFSGLNSYFQGNRIPNDPACPATGTCTRNYQYITSAGQQQYGFYIQFETIPACKFMSSGGTATWFSSAPLCNY